MKKIWFILLILSAGLVFNACSDDENTQQDGNMPVAGYVLPSYMKLGDQVVIPGNGFSGQAELYLKNAAGEELKITPDKIVYSGFLFTVPSELEKGYYTVILKQQGEWELGKVRVVKDFVKIKRLKSLGMDFGDDFILWMNLEYDNENRITSFLTLNENLLKLTYHDDRIDVTGEDVSFSYTLEDGKVVSSTNDGVTTEWSYTEKGFLNSAAGNKYTYEDGNLITTDYSDRMLSVPFEYADNSLNRLGRLDIAACCMYFNEAMEDLEFFACLMGINGKQSVNLPTALMDMGNFIYTYENNDPNGNIIRAVLNSPDYGEFVNIVFQYETAAVFQ